VQVLNSLGGMIYAILGQADMSKMEHRFISCILKELGDWASYEMVQRYAHLAPEHLAEFAGNSKVAKSVAGKNDVVVNIA
jgi:hypothetical protein